MPVSQDYEYSHSKKCVGRVIMRDRVEDGPFRLSVPDPAYLWLDLAYVMYLSLMASGFTIVLIVGKIT